MQLELVLLLVETASTSSQPNLRNVARKLIGTL